MVKALSLEFSISITMVVTKAPEGLVKIIFLHVRGFTHIRVFRIGSRGFIIEISNLTPTDLAWKSSKKSFSKAD